MLYLTTSVSCTGQQCLKSVCLSCVLAVPVAKGLARGRRAELRLILQHRHSTPRRAVATRPPPLPFGRSAAFSIFFACLAYPQSGFVLKFVPSSQAEPQRRQSGGIGMVRAVTPYAAGMTTCALLSLSRHPAGLRPERRKRTVRLSQLWFRAPRAVQVSVGHSVCQHEEFRYVGRCTDRPGRTLLSSSVAISGVSFLHEWVGAVGPDAGSHGRSLTHTSAVLACTDPGTKMQAQRSSLVTLSLGFTMTGREGLLPRASTFSPIRGSIRSSASAVGEVVERVWIRGAASSPQACSSHF